ncbi:MAG TPA: hypothetical protein DDY91_17915 [Planctomycetaceae bacterium]|nr:hypothetical protein [Planctomycetaceae bacterium]
MADLLLGFGTTNDFGQAIRDEISPVWAINSAVPEAICSVQTAPSANGSAIVSLDGRAAVGQRALAQN